MLKSKKGKSILRCRWGKPREKGHIMRVDDSVYKIVQRVSEFDRRRWVSAVIADAFRRRAFSPSVKALIVMALCLGASASLASVDSVSSRRALPARVSCTNCHASGWVYLVCDNCSGKGVVPNPRKSRVLSRNRLTPSDLPCPRCFKGLASVGKKGSGKIRRTCSFCKGQKKVNFRP